MSVMPSARLNAAAEVALSIARCCALPVAAQDVRHPCAKVVAVQAGKGAQRHLPEPWAGNVARSRILFLSSNSSLSEECDQQSGSVVERYPLDGWADDEMLRFFLQRFGTAPDSPATPEGRFRRLDGRLSPRRVRFWVGGRDRACELLGSDASPERDYVMTEVVHCKSKGEADVAQASSHSATLHLDRVIGLSPANLVVVLGSKARDRVLTLWKFPSEFGTRSSVLGAPWNSLVIRFLGGRCRLVAYLPHPTSMEPLRSFAKVYGSHGIDLGPVARGELSPAEFLAQLGK